MTTSSGGMDEGGLPFANLSLQDFASSLGQVVASFASLGVETSDVVRRLIDALLPRLELDAVTIEAASKPIVPARDGSSASAAHSASCTRRTSSRTVSKGLL